MEQVAHLLSTNWFIQLKTINTTDMRKRFPRWERKKPVDLAALSREIRQWSLSSHSRQQWPPRRSAIYDWQMQVFIYRACPQRQDLSVCLSVRERDEVSPRGGDKGKVERSFLLLLLRIVFLFLKQTLSCESAHTRAQRVFTPSSTDWSSQQRVFQCDHGLTLITIALLVSLDLHSLCYFIENHWVTLT